MATSMVVVVYSGAASTARSRHGPRAATRKSVSSRWRAEASAGTSSTSPRWQLRSAAEADHGQQVRDVYGRGCV
ncbi:hypothetical protein ACRAWF_25715 [Streptomyces sp. L7]